MTKHVATGFSSIDEVIGGFLPGQVIVIGGRPTLGKTALALGLSVNMAKDSSCRVIYFSLERLKESVENSLEKMFDGQDLDYSNIIIDDAYTMTVEYIRDECLKSNSDDRSLIVVIDYIQLAFSEGISREQQISTIFRKLKSLAKELRCPVIVLSQLNRGVESRPDKRPENSDLRESGSIEQDADIIMMIYRDKCYDANTVYGNRSEIIVTKNRAGRCGTAYLEWDEARCAFTDIV